MGHDAAVALTDEEKLDAFLYGFYRGVKSLVMKREQRCLSGDERPEHVKFFRIGYASGRTSLLSAKKSFLTHLAGGSL
jgi:hypothetical protein